MVGFVLNASPFMLWFSHSWGPNFKLSLGQLEYILKWLKQYMNGRHFELLWMSLLFSPLKIKTYLWVEYLSLNFFPCQNSIGIYHCRREEQGQHDFYSIIDKELDTIEATQHARTDWTDASVQSQGSFVSKPLTSLSIFTVYRQNLIKIYLNYFTDIYVV